MQIPITRPDIGEEEKRLVNEVLDSGWLVQGDKTRDLEKRFEEVTGARHAIAVNSCSSGQLILSRCLGLGPGDEVILPAYTWISTANSVELTGARPVFVDISLDTWNMNPHFESALTDSTRAVFPVHLFGLSVEMDIVDILARKHGIAIVEDCACSLGTEFDRRHTGTWGNAGCFSMHPRKSITTGEGGMITTNDKEIAELARSLRDHGADRTDLHRHLSTDGFLLPEYPVAGYNFRLTDIQAAIGVAQLGRFDQVIARKREIALRYDESFAGEHFIQTPVIPEKCNHSYQSYVCLLFPRSAIEIGRDAGNCEQRLTPLRERRNQVMAKMAEHGIQVRAGTHCAALQKYYRNKYGYRPADFPRSFIAEHLSISLPIFSTMTDDEVQYVTDNFLRIGRQLCAE